MVIGTNPMLDIAAAAGYNGVVLALSGRLDVVASALSKQQLALSYIGKDFVATAHTDPSFSSVRGTYWQVLDSSSSVAAEVTHDSAADSVQLVMGYCHVSAADGVPSVLCSHTFLSERQTEYVAALSWDVAGWA